MSSRGSLIVPDETSKHKHEPNHLLVLVHGILSSPSDWVYVERKLKKGLGSNFLIYASASNTYVRTFDGIDGAGKRLAAELQEVVEKNSHLRKISFLAHSLGGLFARYAIAVLYTVDDSTKGRNVNGNEDMTPSSHSHGKVARLDPISFITLATPHLGVRGKHQLPILLGIPILEKLAPLLAPFLIGRTGHQLFLTDGKPDQLPLLLRMTMDSEGGMFISALESFRCRILYANVSYDHMVGWHTSSIRRKTELVKPPQMLLHDYKHVVNMEYSPPVVSEAPHYHLETAKAKGAAQSISSTQNAKRYHDIVEEEMIDGLQRVSWKKVDVSFHSAFCPFFAHHNIHVKSERWHSAGAGVVAHIVDTLKQLESVSSLTASL